MVLVGRYAMVHAADKVMLQYPWSNIATIASNESTNSICLSWNLFLQPCYPCCLSFFVLLVLAQGCPQRHWAFVTAKRIAVTTRAIMLVAHVEVLMSLWNKITFAFIAPDFVSLVYVSLKSLYGCQFANVDESQITNGASGCNSLHFLVDTESRYFNHFNCQNRKLYDWLISLPVDVCLWFLTSITALVRCPMMTDLLFVRTYDLSLVKGLSSCLIAIY